MSVGVRHSHAECKLNTYARGIHRKLGMHCSEFYLIDISLTVYCSLSYICNKSCIKLLRIQIKHQILVHIKSIQPEKCGVAFIIQQSQKMQCTEIRAELKLFIQV